MSSGQEWVERVTRLRPATLRGGQRAPHKPLLLLYALGRWHRTGTSRVRYDEAEEPVSQLITEFGPPARSRNRAEMPFFHMVADGVWRLEARKPEQLQPKRAALKRAGAVGLLEPGLEAALQRDPALLDSLVDRVLQDHFPATYVAPICDAVGLPQPVQAVGLDDQTVARRRRWAGLREEVLRAYAYRCAMCGYDGRLGRDPVGLECAHVQWHAYGGPDEPSNALSLCALHHALFDLGVVGLDEAGVVRVSPLFVATSEAADRVVGQLEGRAALRPQRQEHVLEPRHVRWHAEQVFKSVA